jgi:hypothetical protein
MKNWLKAIVLAAAFLGLANAAPAQQHQHESVVTIQGSEHPELIPDSFAYRMFFLVLTQESQPGQPTKAELQRARFQLIGLNDAEIAAVYVLLEEFRAKFNAIVKEYNDSEGTKKGTSVNLADFISKRDALVQLTRDQLLIYLGESSNKLNDHVQSEKRFMNMTQEAQ